MHNARCWTSARVVVVAVVVVVVTAVVVVVVGTVVMVVVGAVVVVDAGTVVVGAEGAVVDGAVVVAAGALATHFGDVDARPVMPMSAKGRIATAETRLPALRTDRIAATPSAIEISPTMTKLAVLPDVGSLQTSVPNTVAPKLMTSIVLRLKSNQMILQMPVSGSGQPRLDGSA